MIVRTKRDGKIMKVECRDGNCPKRKCFSPGHAIHQCAGGNWHEKGLSCVYRDYHGCPKVEE